MRITLNNLRKAYKEGAGELCVIDNLSFEFESASHNAIVGKSGIGKSTLLHLLGGLDKPTSGTVLFDSQDIFSLNDQALSNLRGESVGFVFQFHHLLPEFSALENVAMPLLIAGRPDAQAEDAALGLLRELGLHDRALHRPGQLSGGEQQRVAIARALVVRPKLLLADEPTGNLDQKTAQHIQEILINLSSKFGTTMIIVTHNTELAKSMQNVYQMQPGGGLSLA